MRLKRRVPAIIVLLTAEVLLAAWLAVQGLPARPLALQPDAFYSAFLTSNETDQTGVTLVRLAGVMFLAGIAVLTLVRIVTVWRSRKLPDAVTAPVVRDEAGPAERFDLHQRTQHLLVFSSVGVLALTGLPQAAAGWPGSGWLLGFFGGIEGARSAHRMAATVLDFAILYALGTLVLRAAVQWRIPTALLPTAADVRGLLRLSARRRQPGPFTPRQKLDFWVAALCLPAMSLTGLALAHADLAVATLSPALLLFCAALHRTIAVGFVCYIAMVHWYHVVWSPEVFPLNTAMFTGRPDLQPLPSAPRRGEA